MRTAVENNRALRYKLRSFGIPIDGPTLFCGDNESAIRCAIKPDARLSKKHNQICFHAVREAAAMGEILVAKEKTETNLADYFTKMVTITARWFFQNVYFARGHRVKNNNNKTEEAQA